MHLNQLEQISRKCELNFWTTSDYKDELDREDTYNICSSEINSKEVVGFLFARLIRKDSNNSLVLRKDEDNFYRYDEAELFNIAVLPEYQKKGVGQLIFNTFVDFCVIRNINLVWLEVRRSNLKAQTFYRKNGFQIDYSRNNYYQNPVEDALVLKLILPFDLNSNIYEKQSKT